MNITKIIRTPKNENLRIRDLDSFEERFWLREQQEGLSLIVAADLRTDFAVPRWQQALRRVQERYTALSAVIHKERGRRPFFATSQWEPQFSRIEELGTIDIERAAEQ